MTASKDISKQLIRRLRKQSFAPTVTPDLLDFTEGFAPSFFLPALTPNQAFHGEEERRVTFFGHWLFHQLTGEFFNGVERLSDVKPGLYSQSLSDFLDSCLGLSERPLRSLDELEAGLSGQSFERKKRERVSRGQIEAGCFPRSLAAAVDIGLIFLVNGLLCGGSPSGLLALWIVFELIVVPVFQTSPGIRLFQLELIGRGESPVGFGAWLLRGLVKIVGTLFFALTYAWPMLLGSKRPWHDQWGGLALMHRRPG